MNYFLLKKVEAAHTNFRCVSGCLIWQGKFHFCESVAQRWSGFSFVVCGRNSFYQGRKDVYGHGLKYKNEHDLLFSIPAG